MAKNVVTDALLRKNNILLACVNIGVLGVDEIKQLYSPTHSLEILLPSVQLK
jgi:hypothetical protein